MKKLYYFLLLTVVCIVTACSHPAPPLPRTHGQGAFAFEIHEIYGEGTRATLIFNEKAALLLDACAPSDQSVLSPWRPCAL